MTVKYRFRCYENIRFKNLDCISLVYDRLSGITHVVTEPAPQIIQVLGQDTLSARQIETAMKRQFDMMTDDGDNEFEDIIAARLDEFVNLGLMERLSKDVISTDTIMTNRNIL